MYPPAGYLLRQEKGAWRSDSYVPIRRRERKMLGFKSLLSAQRLFTSTGGFCLAAGGRLSAAMRQASEPAPDV